MGKELMPVPSENIEEDETKTAISISACDMSNRERKTYGRK